MKFNIYFLIKITCLISINAVVLSCTSLKQTDYDNIKNMDLNDTAIPSMNVIHDDQSINSKNQSIIKNLKTDNIIYFPLDQYHVLPVFFAILDTHVDFLRNHPTYQVRIEGHTDERGTPEYNIALGERRAYSVKIYLQSKGVLSNQMEIVSYGKEKPALYGHTEEAYSKNRRVVLYYK